MAAAAVPTVIEELGQLRRTLCLLVFVLMVGYDIIKKEKEKEREREREEHKQQTGMSSDCIVSGRERERRDV